MGRRAAWPPKVHPHGPSGRDRVRYRGKDYYLADRLGGEPGGPPLPSQAQALAQLRRDGYRV